MYHYKYLKYKNKYLNANNVKSGGGAIESSIKIAYTIKNTNIPGLEIRQYDYNIDTIIFLLNIAKFIGEKKKIKLEFHYFFEYHDERELSIDTIKADNMDVLISSMNNYIENKDYKDNPKVVIGNNNDTVAPKLFLFFVKNSHLGIENLLKYVDIYEVRIDNQVFLETNMKRTSTTSRSERKLNNDEIITLFTYN